MLSSFFDFSLLDSWSTSTHSTLFKGFVKATFKTSSTFFTGIISTESKTVFGTSTKSFLFSIGINTFLIPQDNKKDLVEVPKTILDSMEVIPVKNVDEVLKVALTKPLKSVEWVEVDQIAKKDKTKEELSTH